MITLEQLKHGEVVAINDYREFLRQAPYSKEVIRKINEILKDEKDHLRILNTIHPK
jgi:hypothetical protein